MNLREIAVNGVWLRTDGSDIVVMIERDGVWYEAIREPNVGPKETIISHEIRPSGIAHLSKRVEWLMNAPDPNVGYIKGREIGT